MGAEAISQLGANGLSIGVDLKYRKMMDLLIAGVKAVQLIDPNFRLVGVDSIADKALIVHDVDLRRRLLDDVKEHLQLIVETIVGARPPLGKGAKSIQKAIDNFKDMLVQSVDGEQVSHYVELEGEKYFGEKKAGKKKILKEHEAEGKVIGASAVRGAIEIRTDRGDVTVYVDRSEKRSADAEQIVQAYRLLTKPTKISYVGTRRSGSARLEQLRYALEQAGVDAPQTSEKELFD